MSWGLVICSACKRVVHQDGEKIDDAHPRGWTHCEDKSPRCVNASRDYPKSREEIVGRVCGHDGGFQEPNPPEMVRVYPQRDPFTGRRMGGSGTLRNGSCPCGSGKKRKRCCDA